MEGLALLVAGIMLSVILIGPLALILHYFRLPILAAIVSIAAIWLGIFWALHTFTFIRFLGLLPAGLGTYVLWRTAKRV